MGGFPTMAGEALQKFAPAGGALEAAGKTIADAGKTADLSYRVDPDSTWGQAAHGVASFLPTLAAAPLAVAAGVPAAGAAVLGGLGAAVLAGGSAAKEKEDEVLAAGGTPEMAKARGNQEGALQGAVQGIMNAIPGGRLLGGIGERALGATAKMIGKKIGGQTVLDSFVNPSTTRAFLGNTAEMAATGIPLMAGSAAESSHLDQNEGFGFPNTTKDWEAAKASFAPSVAMTTLMAPFGFLGAREAVKAKAATADLVQSEYKGSDDAEKASWQTERGKAIARVAKQMRQVAPEDAANWQTQAMLANADNLPIDMKINFTADDARAKAAQQYQPGVGMRQQGTEPLELTGDQPPQEQQRPPLELTGETPPKQEPFELQPPPNEPKQGELDLRSPAEKAKAEQLELPFEPQKETSGQGELPVTREPTQQVLPHMEEEFNSWKKPPPDEPPGGGGGGGTPANGQGELDLRDTTQRRKDILKENVGTVPQDVRDRLISVNDPEAIPQTLWEIWKDKGGEGAKAAYVERIGDFYKKVTGRDIEDHEGVTTNAKPSEAAPENREGAKPESTPVQAGAAPTGERVEVGKETGGGASGNKDDGNATPVAGSEEAGGVSPIKSAVVRFGGQEFDAPTHSQALNLAKKAGKLPMKDGRPYLGKDLDATNSMDLFRLHDGTVITRDQAHELVGAKRTEEMQPLGDSNATIPGQAERGQEHQDGAGSGQVAPAVDSNRDVGSAQGGQGQGSGQAQAGLAPEERLTDPQYSKILSKVIKKNAKDIESTKARITALEKMAAKRKLSDEQKRNLSERKKQLAMLETEHAKWLKENSRVVNAMEEAKKDKSVRGSKEPAAEKDYYSVLSLPYDKEAGLHEAIPAGQGKFEAGNFGTKGMQLYKYLEAKVMAHQANAEQKEAFSRMAKGFKGNESTRIAADAALKKMPIPLRQQYDKGLAVHLNNIRNGAEWIAPDRASREKFEAALNSVVMEQAHVEEGLEANQYNRVNNLISDADALKNERALKYQPTLERKLREVEDPHTSAQLDKSMNAHDLMEYYAKNHAHPVMRMLAKVIMKANVKSRFVYDPDIIGAKYHPATDTIAIGRGGMNAVTLMHETWHAAAHGEINRGIEAWARFNMGESRYTGSHEPRNDRQAYYALAARNPVFSAKEKAAMRALQTVQDTMEKFRPIMDKNDPAHVLAMKNEHEFVAEANSNPSFAALLDKRGWLQKMWDGLRDAVGISREHTDAFDKLQQASKTLFGQPDRRGILERNYARGEHSDLSNPVGALRFSNYAYRQMESIGDKLLGPLSDPAHNMYVDFKRWSLGLLTENHNHWLADRLQKLVGREENLKALRPFVKAFNGPRNMYRAVMQHGRAMATALKDEGQQFMWKMHDYDGKNPTEKNKMNQVAYDARKANIHPWTKTLEEAQKLNPSVTKEQWEHPLAQKVRNAWDRLAPESKTMLESIYRNLRLQHARHAAEAVRQFAFHNKVQDATPELRKAFDSLDSMKQREDANHAPRSDEDQEKSLRQNITEFRRQLDVVAGSDEKPSDHPLKDAADSARTTTLHFMKQFEEEHARPYVPQGREGSHYVMFTVAGGQAEWKRVHDIVTKKMADGGLERDMPEFPAGNNRRVFMKFQTPSDHRQATREDSDLRKLEKQGLFDVEGKKTWADGDLADKKRSLTGATGSFMDALATKIRNDPDMPEEAANHVIRTLYDSWLQAMPETSPLKAHMSADNTSGAMSNLTHAFVDRTEANNQQLVSIRRAMGLTEAITGIERARKLLGATAGNDDVQKAKEKFHGYIGEMYARAALMQQEVSSYSPTIRRAKSLTASWFLGLSPSYLGMIGYQPYQITLPGIAKTYGYGKTSLSMGRNTANSWAIVKQMMQQGWAQTKGDNLWNRSNRVSDIALKARGLKLSKSTGDPLLDNEMLGAIDHVVDSGLINVGMAAQLYRNDPNDMNKFSQAQRISQIAPHFIEIANRFTAAMTAFEMARKGGKTIEEANAYAAQIIRDTDGDHSQQNVARKLGQRGRFGQLTPLLVGFQQYAIQMSEFLARQGIEAFSPHSTKAERLEAGRGLTGIAVATAMIAGTLGLPFSGLVTGVYNAGKQFFQDDGSDPPDAVHEWSAWMKQLFGEKGGEVVARGLPHLLNFDMSGRSGYQDLLPFTNFLNDRASMQDRFEHAAMGAAGPTAGIITGLFSGADDMYHGNWLKGITEASPAFMRNAYKAYRLSEYGEERTTSPNTPLKGIDTSGWDVMMRAAGFTSAEKSQESEESYAYQNTKAILQARSKVLRDKMLRDDSHGDYEALQRDMENAMRFAMQQPRFNPLASIGQGIAAQRQEEMVGAMPGMGGVQVPPSELPYYQQFKHGGGIGKREQYPQF